MALTNGRAHANDAHVERLYADLASRLDAPNSAPPGGGHRHPRQDRRHPDRHPADPTLYWSKDTRPHVRPLEASGGRCRAALEAVGLATSNFLDALHRAVVRTVARAYRGGRKVAVLIADLWDRYGFPVLMFAAMVGWGVLVIRATV